MVAISVKKFGTSFISRTKELLEHYDDYSNELEFTLLINTLVGLLILPKEFTEKGKGHFKKKFLKQKLHTFPLLERIFRNETVEIQDENGQVLNQKKFYFKSGNNMNEILPENLTIEKVLRRFRNGIAHMNITPTQSEGKWAGVIIRNFKPRSYFCNFATYLTYEELRDFAHFIASNYEDSIKL